MFCWPSSRLTVIVNGLNPPAWMLRRTSRQATGLNGNGSAHDPPLGPDAMLNVEEGLAGSLPDHGAIDARRRIRTTQTWCRKRRTITPEKV